MSNSKYFKALAGAAVATLLTTASASALTVSGTESTPAGTNDFATVAGMNFLQGLTLSSFAGQLAQVTGVFAESAFSTSFSGGGFNNIIFENDSGTSAAISGGTWNINFTGWLFDGSGAAKSAGITGVASDNPAGMGLYTTKSVAGGSVSFSKGETFYLAYDDLIQGDDNHDDLILLVKIIDGGQNQGQVPLPAGVWLLGSAVAGLGIARRRRKA